MNSILFFFFSFSFRKRQKKCHYGSNLQAVHHSAFSNLLWWLPFWTSLVGFFQYFYMKWLVMASIILMWLYSLPLKWANTYIALVAFLEREVRPRIWAVGAVLLFGSLDFPHCVLISVAHIYQVISKNHSLDSPCVIEEDLPTLVSKCYPIKIHWSIAPEH